MLPNFLIPESEIRQDGTGPEVSLESSQAKLLLITLGVTRVIEQESLEVSIWGSPDKTNWGTKPLVTFPQKFYCGTYEVQLDLSERADVQFLRAKWKVNRWGRGEAKPLFDVYAFAQVSESRAAAKSA
jgi:hypothetical protein